MDIVTRLLCWYAGAARDLPWRRPDAGPWGVLVSEVMLQQTPVARVLPVYTEWLRRWPRPADLAAAERGEAVRVWGRLGYPRRALRLHECAVAIGDRLNGRVPATVSDLLTLPGVGPYTARAVACFGHGRREAVVDTNVRRVVTRWVRGEERAGSPAGDLALVEPTLPADPTTAATFAAALMELGALVCTARSPRCQQCPLAGSCAWLAAGRPASALAPPRRPGYAGTDRQVRGLLLAVLREVPGSVAAGDLAAVWPAEVQRERALATLVADGLVVPLPGSRFALPSVPDRPAGASAGRPPAAPPRLATSRNR